MGIRSKAAKCGARSLIENPRIRKTTLLPSQMGAIHAWASLDWPHVHLQAHESRTPYLITKKIPNHKTTTAPPSGIHGIPGEKMRSGLHSVEQYHGALWFKGNFGCKSHTTSHLHHSSLACSQTTINTPIHSNTCIQTIVRTREESGVVRRLKKSTSAFKRQEYKSNFSESLKLTRTMIAQHTMAFFWGVCLLTLGWMTYGEASVPENLDKSIDELKVYYVSRSIWISKICHITDRKWKKRVQKVDW